MEKLVDTAPAIRDEVRGWSGHDGSTHPAAVARPRGQNAWKY